MLISVYTPTNDFKWLKEAHDSLLKQTYDKFEWIILPNGENTGHLPATLSSDQRIRVLPHSEAAGIGALKKECCKAAKGEMLVELDHDDMLLPDCLETLKTTQENTGAGFLFSDCITFNPDHSSETYMKEFGWEHYKFKHGSHEYDISKSFPITARSLCEILFAPNHVRAWTRDAYRKAGGYAHDKSCADDHDLICRTYLAGVEFAHIDRPLYMYRRHDNNYCYVNNDKIDEAQFLNFAKYTHALIFEECRRKGRPMYDLGGAHNCPKELGFKSIDMTGDVDIKINILNSQQFWSEVPKNVGCFRAQDFLEHVPPSKVVQLMNNIYHKLAPGGWFITSTPSVSGPEGLVGRGAFQDPTHVSFWSENNFWYFIDSNYSKYVPEIKSRFQMVRLYTDYPSEWHQENLIPYVAADMMAIKDQKVPGQVFI